MERIECGSVKRKVVQGGVWKWHPRLEKSCGGIVGVNQEKSIGVVLWRKVLCMKRVLASIRARILSDGIGIKVKLLWCRIGNGWRG